MAKTNPLAFLKLSQLPPHQTQAMLQGKWVVITGATSGIGLAAVHRFARGLANQIWLVRNEGKAKELQETIQTSYGVRVVYYVADFSDLNSVEAALIKLKAETQAIDILINNAGLHSTRRLLTKHGYEMSLTVNHLASLFITYACLPLLKQSKDARIIQVNSEGHRFGSFNLKDPHFQKRRYTGLKGYGASKTAQLLSVWHLSPSLNALGIKINAMHPGEVQSNIGLNNGWLYRWFKKVIINRMLKDVNRSAEALYYLAADPSQKNQTGQYFYLTHLAQPAKHALNLQFGWKVMQWSTEKLKSVTQQSQWLPTLDDQSLKLILPDIK
jgi:NAD(P)-dependent dehydrogenase (short-subunit alcohol dehydrogenase family)